MDNPVLVITRNPLGEIVLSWTDSLVGETYDIYWKSNKPPGQNYVLLATTANKYYLISKLNPSLIYDIYIKVWSGPLYFYSNVVELFVACSMGIEGEFLDPEETWVWGRGVVLSAEPPRSPLAQESLSVISQHNIGNFYNMAQDPNNKDVIYGIEVLASQAGFNVTKLTVIKGSIPTKQVIGTIPYHNGDVTQGIIGPAKLPGFGAIEGGHYCFIGVANNLVMVDVTLSPFSWAARGTTSDQSSAQPIILRSGAALWMSFTHWYDASFRVDSKLLGSPSSGMTNILNISASVKNQRIICTNNQHTGYYVYCDGYREVIANKTLPTIGASISLLTNPDAEFPLTWPQGDGAGNPGGRNIPQYFLESGTFRYFFAQGKRAADGHVKLYWYKLDTGNGSCSWTEMFNASAWSDSNRAVMQALACSGDRLYFSSGYEADYTKIFKASLVSNISLIPKTLTGFDTGLYYIHHIFASTQEVLCFHSSGNTYNQLGLTRINDTWQNSW